MLVTSVYGKPHLTLDAQVALLRSRGLVVDDDVDAAQWLSRVGYYRLSGYWYVFREQRVGAPRDDTFAPGTTFRQVVDLYEFDRHLKLLVIDAVERVEISLRFHVGYQLGKRGPYAHLDPSTFDGSFTLPGRDESPSQYEEWWRRVSEAQDRSREDFVQHFRDKYDGRLPVWCVTEILDFGGLSRLYQGLARRDRDAVAAALSIVDAAGRGDGSALANWLKAFTHLRNLCAHHSRLWNRNLVDRIAPRRLQHLPELAGLRDLGSTAGTRLFVPLSVMGWLLDVVAPDNSWTSRVAAHVETGLPPSGRSQREMGFPTDWRGRPPWSSSVRAGA